MTQSDQQHIEDLQFRIAFLEQNLDDLNDIVTQQQAQISLMERAVKHLNSRLEQVSPANIKSPEDETPPPHY
ncbi:SlyX family protein [Oceaniserpentilla sp. 4NH20-0058]|uniref:SlyX family protein n=1 Tax=Oceaniserpentilla sp. 4NH20-0058 TaxID=3127660 RepID=UPI003102D87B